MATYVWTLHSNRTAAWLGRAMSLMPALFLVFDGAAKLVKPDGVVRWNAGLGYEESVLVPLGIVLLACTALYLIPRTAVLGAILLTGYLGGAVATNVRIGAPVARVLFPVFVGALLWGGLWLRDAGLRLVMPVRPR